jgi:hypothetical protein
VADRERLFGGAMEALCLFSISAIVQTLIFASVPQIFCSEKLNVNLVACDGLLINTNTCKFLI